MRAPHETVRYDKQGRHVYLCERLKSDYGGQSCQRVAGPPLDEFVVGEVLRALEPAALELSLAAAERLEKEREELDGLWRKRLERTAYEAERAGRHYRLLEPENRLVARQLARDWEEKLGAEQRLREDYDRFRSEKPRSLSAAEREAIRRLSEDIPALWEASTTTNADRKGIVRQVIESIRVEVEGDSEWVGVQIRWAGGAETGGIVIRPVAKLEQLSYYPELCERGRALAAPGLSAGTIAKRLNEEGYRPPKRREEFGRQGIGDLMRRLGLVAVEDGRPPEGRDGALGEDEWWLAELAGKLAMPKVTLYNWIRRGWVRAHQERGRHRR